MRYNVYQTCEQYGVLAFFGLGYGEAVRAARVERQLQRLVDRLGGDHELVEHSVYYDFEDGAIQSRSERTVREIGQAIIEVNERFDDDSSVDQIVSLPELRGAYADVLDCGEVHLISLLTEKEAEEEKQQEEYRRLEQVATDFAASSGSQMGTFSFIRALEQKIQQVETERSDFNSGEARMERWMDTRYAGGGSEVFFDDTNFENGRFANRLDDLRGVLAWLEHRCPLLMAQYREMKLAETWQEEDEEAEAIC